VRWGSETCDCVFVLRVTQLVQVDIADFRDVLFIENMADALGKSVDYSQIVILSKTAGSTVVVYEVQPPQGTQWFGDKAEVDAMVEKLWEGDYELDASFGTSQVTEVTNPVTVLYTSAPSDNGDDNLLLVIAAFASALVVLVGVAVTTVLYYRRRALRRSFNNRAAAAVNEVESLDGHETRALYASPTASSSRSPAAAKVHPTPERYDEGDDRI